MNSGKTVFRQPLQFLPRHDVNPCVRAIEESTGERPLPLSISSSVWHMLRCRDVRVCETLKPVSIPIGTHAITPVFIARFPGLLSPIQMNVAITASLSTLATFLSVLLRAFAGMSLLPLIWSKHSLPSIPR